MPRTYKVKPKFLRLPRKSSRGCFGAIVFALLELRGCAP